MNDLITSIMGELDGSPMNQLSAQLGTDAGSTQTAVQAALPVLLGALARNSASSGGADALSGALDRDHDGSILDDIGGFLGGASQGPGEAILRHVLGQLDAASLAVLLGSQQNQAQNQNPALGMLSSLHSDNDGSVIDDIGSVLGGFLPKR